MSKKKWKLYLAGGLFNAGERLHITFLEMDLKDLGYEVISPMREAFERFDSDSGKFDLEAVVGDCREAASSTDNLYVGCIDGADVDGGTAVEYGMAIASTGRAVVYRTDFRTAIDREVGINSMFSCERTELIYSPCFFTEIKDALLYYRELALQIHEKVSLLVQDENKI